MLQRIDTDPLRPVLPDTMGKFAEQILQNAEALARLNQLYQDIDTLQTRPEFQSDHDSMGDAVRTMVQILKPADTLMLLDAELPTVVFTIQAMPGSGKSYTTEKVCEILDVEGITYTLIHWDQIEKILQLEGVITTESDQPFTQEDLQAVFDRIVQLMISKAQSGTVLLLDLPSETSIRISHTNSAADSEKKRFRNMLHARHYATNILDMFNELYAKHQHEISTDQIDNSNAAHGEGRDTSPLYMYENHLLPGPCMDLLREMRYASALLKHLNKPNKIRALFGLAPLNEDELEKANQKLGGSPEQVEVADAAWNSLLDTVTHRNMNAISLSLLQQMVALGYVHISEIDQFLPAAIEIPNIDDLNDQIEKIATILSRPLEEYTLYVQRRLTVINLILHNSKSAQFDQDNNSNKAVSTFLSNPDHLFTELFASEEKMKDLRTAILLLDFIRSAAKQNWVTAYEYLTCEFEKLLDNT